ncbi:hypothetical protein E3N88_45179 [Mikania micrantha]|uniref:Retrotransposon Copia-like N-terminal domain-containing protein n=1 Tax=Mikania micrantha TaxID=192012 RepID=A0A5N6L9W0_9ASTR|nr:hypothetical protein E3N88_45179 [Mikania micrantha]
MGFQSFAESDTLNPSSEEYDQWEQEDLIVFSWLIQNIEPALAGNLTEYPTAKTLWDALVVTYIRGRDKLQTFNLLVKANDIKQNNTSLEDFWIALLGGNPIGGPMATRRAPKISDLKEEERPLPPELELTSDDRENSIVLVVLQCGQGENQCSDTLTWLEYVPHVSVVEDETSPVVQSEDPNISATQKMHPNLICEVSNTYPHASASEYVEHTENATHSENIDQGEHLQE